MSLGRYVLQQFARPHGRLAAVFAALMNRGNRRLNQCSVEALAVNPDQRALEVGFGGGMALELLLAGKGCVQVAGLDPSEEMVRAASRRLGPWIQDGRLTVRQGTAENLPWADSELDRVLSVNSIFYWPDPSRGVREIRRVLRPDGVLVLGLRTKAVADRIGIERLGYWSPSEDDLSALLTDAGFTSLSWQRQREAGWGDFLVLTAKNGSP